ncbi:PPE family protein [Mycobacterium sp. 4858]|uniref:PPE family protein n=1 Tax=Mycobacterium sp. 4858 TaxID=2057185 RepID=UPI000C819852|nr:PPE family protein [Mycobacterium sp. 4858]
MIDFGAFPPEFNSARMYAGPGPVSLVAAAVAWDSLAAELHAAASCYRSVIAGLTTGRWMGPSSLAMASAFAPYMAWMAGAAARAAETAGQARLAVEVYEAAFAMTVPPPAVAANRVQLATLIATNFFGQNAAAIAATEAEYGEMWAQDAAAMYEYAAGSAVACELTPFNPPPDVTNPAGVASQSSAVAQAETLTATHTSLSNVMSTVPSTLQGLSSPMTAGTVTLTDAGAGAGSAAGTATNSASSSLMSALASSIPSSVPSYLMAAATPLYGMSSILGMAQTAQGLASGAMAAAGTAASTAASAASTGAGALGSLGSLGSGVIGSLGSAASLGPLAVPASWTSVIPAAQSAASALPTISLAGANNVPPSIMGSLPRLAAASGKNLGPRYGVIPTVMTRPPSGGYA